MGLPAEAPSPPQPPNPRHLGTAIAQMLLISFLSLLHGGIVSLNIFAVPIEHAAAPPHALDGLWAPAISAINFLYAPTALLAAPYLVRPAHKLHTVRALIAVAAAGYLAFGVAASGVALSNRFLTAVAPLFLALPFTMLALVKIDLLAAWVPSSLGLAVGLATLTFGSGSVLATSIYATLLDRFPVGQSITIVALFSASTTLLAAPLLRMPPPVEPQARDGYTEIGAAESETLTLYSMLRQRTFWQYALACGSFSAGFAVDPYFFKLGSVYGGTGHGMLRWYQGGTTASIVFNLGTATVCDIARARRGPLQSGSRNVVAAVLAGQAGALGQLSLLGGALAFGQWAGAASYLRLCHLAAFNFSALLAADFFGPNNVSLVFGVGGALSLGFGDGLGTMIMVLVDRVSGSTGTSQHYVPYYAIGVVWTLAGLASTLSLRKLRQEDSCESCIV